MFGRGLRTLSIASVVLVIGAFALVFFYAPNDADQGFVQKIFYLHVPLAIVALCGFVAGGVYGHPLPAHGDRAHDLRSYVAIHLSLILGRRRARHRLDLGARRRGAHWWLWDEPTLVSFLIVFLLYACYQPLRFSIEDPRAPGALRGGVRDRRRRVRAAELPGRAARAGALHPRVLSTTGGDMPGSMLLTFLVCWPAMACLFVTLWKYELASKHASMQLRALRRRSPATTPPARPRRTAAPTQL